MSTLLSLPSCLHRTTAFVILALAIFMIAAHTGITAIVAQRTSLSPKAKTIGPFVVAAFLASWLAIAILVGDGTNFPIPVESRQGISGLVALIPLVIALIALFTSKNLRAINTATPSAWLIAIQTYRVAGIMFIYPFVTLWNLAGRFWLPCWHWGRANWDLRAHRGLDGCAKPAKCGEVGGSVESFWHARSH